VTDRNGVTVTQTFDRLGRVTQRDYPDGGFETFSYTARGLSQYERKISDTLTALTSYAYDAARRKTSETTPKGEDLLYTYYPGGDLWTLQDDRNNTTTWYYDAEGRVSGKHKVTGSQCDSLAGGIRGRLTERAGGAGQDGWAWSWAIWTGGPRGASAWRPGP
jgi:YD repeat-containing protein